MVYWIMGLLCYVLILVGMGTPNIRIKIGIVSRDFADMSPAAKEFVQMLEENFK